MRRYVLGVATATALLLGGCTATPDPSQPTVISPGPDTTSATPTATAPAQAEHGSLARCLREHGVPESAGTAVLGPPSNVDPGVWDQAMRACAPLEPGPAG